MHSCSRYMNWQVWEDLVSSPKFSKLLQWNQKIILKQMVETVSSKATVSEAEALEVVSMEATPSVPTVLRSPRPKKSATKENQNKPVLVR